MAAAAAAAFFSAMLPGFLMGLGVAEPDVAAFLPARVDVLLVVAVLDAAGVLLANGTLAVVVVVVLGVDNGTRGFDGVVVPLVFDAGVLPAVVGRVVDLGVLAVAELGAVVGLEDGVVRGVVVVGVAGLGVERCDSGTRGVVVAGRVVLDVGVLRADLVSAAAFLAADAALAALVLVADGARSGVRARA